MSNLMRRFLPFLSLVLAAGFSASFVHAEIILDLDGVEYEGLASIEIKPNLIIIASKHQARYECVNLPEPGTNPSLDFDGWQMGLHFSPDEQPVLQFVPHPDPEKSGDFLLLLTTLDASAECEPTGDVVFRDELDFVLDPESS